MQSDDLDWDGAVPISKQFADPYFSRMDGLAETRHVFLQGTGLPERFKPGFVIAELGFGTGLNFLAAWAAWRAAGASGRLTFVSFEAFPLDAADMAKAAAVWPNLQPFADEMQRIWPKMQPIADVAAVFADAELHVIIGDARRRVPTWDGAADAWFLDGFAPARNPELWEPELLQAVYDHTRPGGGAATYSAAGAVRRGLAAAGFSVEKQQGYAGKRHMTVARRGDAPLRSCSP